MRAESRSHVDASGRLTRPALRGPLGAVICDVCGRDNADNLTFCQDCGRRLRQQRGVAPTPPNGMPQVELPAAMAPPAAPPPPTLDSTSATSRDSSPSGPPSAGRRPRPSAPLFSFSNVEPAEHAGGGQAPARPAAAALPPPPPAAARPAVAPSRPQPAPPRPASANASAPAGPSATRPPAICAECRTANPPEYRFCVTCGTALRRPASDKPAAAVPAAPVPGAPPPLPAAPRPAPAAPPTPAPAPRPEPAPPFEGEKIIGAPVVDIASSGAVPAKTITCGRCQGQSVAGTRFCKYCGASLGAVAAHPAAGARAGGDGGHASSGDHRGGDHAASEDHGSNGHRAPQAASPRPQLETDPLAHLADPPPPPAVARAEPPRRAEPVGRVPLGPIGRPGVPAGHSPMKSPAISAVREMEPGMRADVSELAGSPIPAEPLALPLPPRAAPARWKGGRLVVIVEDGSEGRSFSLAEGQLDVGRTDGDIILEDDAYVSPRHARLRRLAGDGSWILRDLDSTNHVYLRLRKQHPLKDGDLLLLGLEVLQFQTVSDGERGLGHAIQHGTFLFGSPATPRRARLCQRTVEGVIRDVYHVFRDETVIGREVGDIVFTADPFLSRRHAAIRRNPVTMEFSLVDLDSSNGTYVAIRGEVAITDGDYLRIGQHLFRVDLG